MTQYTQKRNSKSQGSWLLSRVLTSGAGKVNVIHEGDLSHTDNTTNTKYIELIYSVYRPQLGPFSF